MRVRSMAVLALAAAGAMGGCNRARVESIDLMNQGIEAESKEMHSKAVELLTKSTEIDPECLECRLALATVHEKTKDWANAAEHFRRAIDLAPEDAETHYKLGATLQEMKKWDEAKVAFEKAISLNENHFRAYYKLGQVLQAMGDIDAAGPAYKKAAEINPNFSYAFIAYGILFMDLGWLEPKYYDDAVKVFSEGVRVNEGDAALHSLLGSTLEAALFRDSIPTAVYKQLLANVHRTLPTFHRYLALRKRMLGLDVLRYQDLYVPMTASVDLRFQPDEARAITLQALALLGKEYVQALRQGFESRWTDYLPSTAKRSGAYSTGVYGVHPYQLLNFNGLYEDLSTLAHESGHSMHTWYSFASQPYATSDYPIFVAEVASDWKKKRSK